MVISQNKSLSVESNTCNTYLVYNTSLYIVVLDISELRNETVPPLCPLVRYCSICESQQFDFDVESCGKHFKRPKCSTYALRRDTHTHIYVYNVGTSVSISVIMYQVNVCKITWAVPLFFTKLFVIGKYANRVSHIFN